MRKGDLSLMVGIAFAIMLMSQTGLSAATNCKELNHVACYAGKNEGYFCSKKDQTTTETRWYYDKGTCRKFDYKGCYGNRNRFCTKQQCEQRCGGNGNTIGNGNSNVNGNGYGKGNGINGVKSGK